MFPYKSRECFSQPDCPLCGPSKASRACSRCLTPHPHPHPPPPPPPPRRREIKCKTPNKKNFHFSRALIWRRVSFSGWWDGASISQVGRGASDGVMLKTGERTRRKEKAGEETEGCGKQSAGARLCSERAGRWARRGKYTFLAQPAALQQQSDFQWLHSKYYMTP